MKITFLLSFTPNPRMTKRLRAIEKEHDIFLIDWKRKKEYLWGSSWDGVRSCEIDLEADIGKPLQRIGQTIRFARSAWRALREERPDCIYVQNLDMLLIACCYKIKTGKSLKLVYEIADLHPLLIQPPDNRRGRLIQGFLRAVDKICCKKIDLLVNTSGKYYEIYYSKFVPREKLLVIPNVPDRKAFKNYRKKSGGPFTVGFIGAVQFKEELKLLIREAKVCGVQVRVAGSSLDDEIENLCKEGGFPYHGSYRYDEEIAQLYGKLDCVFAVYDASDRNVRAALPNKLYEAILCELPILVAKGTYLSEVVSELGVGLSVTYNNPGEYREALITLKNNCDAREKMVQNCREKKALCDLPAYNRELLRRLR